MSNEMTMDTIGGTGAASQPALNIGHRRLFVATICVGSFLLFLVQPMIARMALPKLGGAPTVWNSAMLVYQALLLAGYAYAHGLGKLAPKTQGMVHIAAFLVAALALPIGLLSWTMPADASPITWVPMFLLGSIGPLFFVVSAQAPLMQKWFGLTGGENPYPLYAASNLGSFAGLLTYPLVVEPLIDVEMQSWIWSGGYIVLLGLIILCALRLRSIAPALEQVQEIVEATPRPTIGTVLFWVLISAIPSGLMLSTSLHLTTDIVAMPLLWVMPLGLYLLSFSVAFSENQKLAGLCRMAAPVVLLGVAFFNFVYPGKFALAYAGALLLMLFLVSTTLHNRLYLSRPSEKHLTFFYLMLSLGGVIGGIFCALLAPQFFSWAFEHPLLLCAAAFTLRSDVMVSDDKGGQRRASLRPIILTFVVGAALLVLSQRGNSFIDKSTTQYVAAGLIAVLALASIRRPIGFGLCIALILLTMNGWSRVSYYKEPGRVSRSYFGIYGVSDYEKNRTLVHGTTVHGKQLKDAGRALSPTSYYAPKSGVGLAMRAAPTLYGAGANISVIGLGTGTLSCYAKPDQAWSFYEIDPLIVKIARDTGQFTFLKNCTPNAKMILGDARLKVTEQPQDQAHVLAVDAFSSDAIPIHLLTKEAFDVYGRYIRQDGLLMVHISNRFLDLKPVVASMKSHGWHMMVRDYNPDKKIMDEMEYTPSLWIALSRDKPKLDKLAMLSTADENWEPMAPKSAPVEWTDNHASILSILKW
jgi:spermidine synthase